jgi:hypothetical protein
MPASLTPDKEDERREKLEDQARDVQEEARMVLPGVQALFSASSSLEHLISGSPS